MNPKIPMTPRFANTILSRLLPCAALLALVALTGCASKNFVRGEVATTHEMAKQNEAAIERTQTRVAAAEEKNVAQDQEIDAASKTAMEALQRAQEAGKLAEGKLLFETVLTDDDVKFAFDRADLADDARGALDQLGAQLTAEDAGVYLEIQGHTDATGADDYNLRLGEQRAETVRRYLNQEHRIPLHRISTISYGEAEPVADNGTRDGRSQNRRVVVVVLR